MKTLFSGVEEFSSLSGLHPNISKSNCFFRNISHNVVMRPFKLQVFSKVPCLSATQGLQYKVAQEQCCLPKQEGGLGIRDPREWNFTAILLQDQRIIQPTPSSLWITWLHSSFFRRKPFQSTNIPYSCPWCVNKLLKTRNVIKNHLQYQVGTNPSFLM